MGGSIRPEGAEEGAAAVVEAAMATVPCAIMQVAGIGVDAPGCSGANGVAANADDAAGAEAAYMVRGAPAQFREERGDAQHPDLVAYSSALWACLGDPAEALAAVGGG